MSNSQVKIAPGTVRLSIIVISIHSQLSLIKCLDSIFACPVQEKIEIVVVNSDTGVSPEYLTAKYPQVSLIHHPEKMGVPELAAAAIAHSSGEIIALTDSLCVVDSGWIASILEAHKSQAPVIGGMVEMLDLTTATDWAAYFCEYGEFMYPLKSGVVTSLPGNNISFKRSALSIGNEFVKNKFWKTFWCQKLQTEGVELISDASILIYYTKRLELGSFLRRRFQNGRCFAGMRLIEFTIIKRIIYITGSLLLPLIFLYRIMSVIIAKNRHLKELILSLPVIVLAVIFWSWGETWGFLAGTGESCKHLR